jgi:hypothetical protein
MKEPSMENDKIFQQLVQLLGELVTATSPEWTLQFLQAGIEEAGQGGGEMEPEVMSQGGPQAMPSRSGPAPMTNAFATKQ